MVAEERSDSTGDDSAGGGWASVRQAVRTWIVRDARRALITAAVAFGVAWLVNVYIIAVRYEGTGIPPGGAATVSGNRLTGVIFWVVISTVVLTIVGYAQQVGWSRTGAELRVLPKNLAAAFTAAPATLRWAAVLWGAAVSLLVATIFSKAAAGALGVGVLLVAASPAVTLVGRGLRRAGGALLGRVAGANASDLDSGAASTATVLGAALGMAVAWQTGPWFFKLILAVAAAAGAAVLLQRGSGTAVTAAILMGLLAVAEIRDLLGAVAFADDGGWREGGGTLTQWIGSPGSGRVMTQSVLGGLSGSFGAVVGSAVGTSMGSAGAAGFASAVGATTGSAAATAAANPPLAMGGLSGEFAAVESGATPTAPNVPIRPPQTRSGGKAGATAPDGGTAPGPDGATSPATTPDTPGDGAGDGAGDDLAIGGLSGEFSADTSDAAGRGGAAPGRSGQERSGQESADTPDDQDTT